MDFGGAKRAKTQIEGKSPKEYLDWLLDHTVLVAQDDPQLEEFRNLHNLGIIQLRILPNVGAERFAEFIFHKLNIWASVETNYRVNVKSVEFFEHNKNSAIYENIKY